MNAEWRLQLAAFDFKSNSAKQPASLSLINYFILAFSNAAAFNHSSHSLLVGGNETIPSFISH